MLIDMCLSKFDIYQGSVAPNCYKSHTNFIRAIQTLIVRRNIVSTAQSVRAYFQVIYINHPQMST